MAVISEVVIGATRKELRVTVIDEDGNPVNITGGTVRLQGTSADLPANNIDEAGLILDGPNGVARWPQIGSDTYVSLTDIGSKAEATYNLRVKFTDPSSLVDYGPEFSITWKKPPI